MPLSASPVAEVPPVSPGPGRRLGRGDRHRQPGEQRLRPGPRGTVAHADGAVPRGLHAQRQAEDLDEADRGRVVERVALVVGREVLVVQRQRERRPTTDARPWSSRTRTSPVTTRWEDSA